MLMVAELEVESKVGPGLQTLTTMKQRSGGLEALACPLSHRGKMAVVRISIF